MRKEFIRSLSLEIENARLEIQNNRDSVMQDETLAVAICVNRNSVIKF